MIQLPVRKNHFCFPYDGHGWMRTSFSFIEHVLILSNMTTVTDGWTQDSQTKLMMSDLDATLQGRCITDNIDLRHLKLYL